MAPQGGSGGAGNGAGFNNADPGADGSLGSGGMQSPLDGAIQVLMLATQASCICCTDQLSSVQATAVPVSMMKTNSPMAVGEEAVVPPQTQNPLLLPAASRGLSEYTECALSDHAAASHGGDVA